MKKRVLYYALNSSDSSSFYRILGVLPYINNPDFELIDISHVNDFGWETFVNANVLILQRPFNMNHVNMISLAKDMGLKVILDYDDDLLNVDMYNPTYELYLDAKVGIKACIEQSDEVWVSTVSIKESLSVWSKNITVIPNAHNDYLFKVEDKKEFNKNSKTVAWRGGATHEADVYENALKIVDMVNNNREWRFNFFGERFTFLEQRCGVNYNAVTPMSTVQFYRYFQRLNPNIVFFPLRDTKFNRGKSSIAFLEATYAGAVFLGNRNLPEFNIVGTGDISYWIQENFNGFIVDDMAESNLKSWNYIVDNFLLSNINKLRTERILANL
jgi:hypothetical protein